MKLLLCAFFIELEILRRRGAFFRKKLARNIATNMRTTSVLACRIDADRVNPSGHATARLVARQQSMNRDEHILRDIRHIRLSDAKMAKRSANTIEMHTKNHFENRGRFRSTGPGRIGRVVVATLHPD